jgi:hypothetical protein
VLAGDGELQPQPLSHLGDRRVCLRDPAGAKKEEMLPRRNGMQAHIERCRLCPIRELERLTYQQFIGAVIDVDRRQSG